MKQVGSQIREHIEDSEYDFFMRIDDENIVLHNRDTDLNELFAQKDDYAGHVIVVGNMGYEFVQTTDLWE